MIPLWVKIACTAFVLVLLPAYWRNYGPVNFLWFSDIALLGITVALWSESRLLASMMAVAVLLPEVVWNVAFFARLTTGLEFGGLIGYMFEPENPLFLRGLSLFHVFMPLLLVWMIARLGYDRRAWMAMTLVAWIVLPASYLFSNPSDNVNWVFGIGGTQRVLQPVAYVALLMLAFPAALYFPTHLLLRAIFR